MTWLMTWPMTWLKDVADDYAKALARALTKAKAPPPGFLDADADADAAPAASPTRAPLRSPRCRPRSRRSEPRATPLTPRDPSFVGLINAEALRRRRAPILSREWTPRWTRGARFWSGARDQLEGLRAEVEAGARSARHSRARSRERLEGATPEERGEFWRETREKEPARPCPRSARAAPASPPPAPRLARGRPTPIVIDVEDDDDDRKRRRVTTTVNDRGTPENREGRATPTT